MLQVILTIHVLIVASLVGMVLLQRSEGGALGIGGGGGGLMSGRAAANGLTRGTALLAALFFLTSMGLAIFADKGPAIDEQIESLTGEKVEDTLNLTPGEVDAGDLLDSFGAGDSAPAGDLVDEATSEDAQTLPPSEEPASTPAAEEAGQDDAGGLSSDEETPSTTP